MPWSVKAHEGKFCLFKPDSDTPIEGGCHATKEEAEKHKAALYANTKETEAAKYALEHGETLVAIAATIKPHLKQRDHDIVMVERNGKRMVRVPIARKGIYRHKLAPDGKLILDDVKFSKIIENYNKAFTDYNLALDLRHGEEKGALALLDKSDGGELVVEDNWLVSYGLPTSKRAEEIIESKSWRYASAEIHPNYQSNLVHQLSSDDLEIYELEEEKGKTMSDVTITQEEYTRLKEANEKLIKLEAPEPVIPESTRLKLESLERQVKESNRAIMKSNVALAVSEMRSYEDSKGRSHSEAFINMVEALLLGDPIGEGDETIKLESDNGTITAEQVATYYRQGLLKLSKTTPGQVTMKGKTEPDDAKLEAGNGALKFSKDEVTEFAKQAWQGFVPEVN